MALGVVQGIANAIMSHKANKRLESLLGQDPSYMSNPLVAQQLAMAQNLYNGRMEGAGSLERNIYKNQANTNNAINKNATDSSQALALAMGGQNQSNNAFANLRQEESQNKYAMLQNLNNAYANMVGEGDKVYNDKVRKFGDLSQIRGMQQQNRSNALNGIFNGLNSDINQAIQIGGLVATGGLSGLAGGMGGGGQQGGTYSMPFDTWRNRTNVPNTLSYGH